MSDNPTVDNGSLTDYVVSADEVVATGELLQRVKLAYSADGVATHVAADGDGLLVNLGANNDVTVTGTAAVSNAGITTIAGAVAGTEMQVDVVAALPAGTNAIGKLAANSGVDIGDVDVLTLPNVTLAAGTNTNEVVGDAAHDAAISGNPVRLAGRALTADYTAVATGDTADLITSILGKQVILPYALPGAAWKYAAASGGIVNTTAITIKAAGAAGVVNYLTHLSVINGHATVSTEVAIRDGAAGTVIWRGFAQAAGGGVAETFVPPLASTAATLLEVVCITTGSAVYVNAQGYAGAE